MSQSYTNLGTITKPDQWADVRGTIIYLEDETPEGVDQAGIIADTNGVKRFRTLTKDDHPDVELGSSYRLNSVVTSKTDAELLNITSQTSLTEIQSTISPSRGVRYHLKRVHGRTSLDSSCVSHPTINTFTWASIPDDLCVYGFSDVCHPGQIPSDIGRVFAHPRIVSVSPSEVIIRTEFRVSHHRSAVLSLH